MRARLLLLTSLLALALACGKAKPDPEKPVDLTPASRAGYWYAGDDDQPVLFHFGAPLVELAGETQTVESTLFGQVPQPGTYALADRKLTLTALNGGGFEGTVQALTQTTMEILPTRFQAHVLHFWRVEGCGGPSLWMAASGQPVAAAWGDDGSLHLLTAHLSGIIGSQTGQYSVVPPGRCSAVTPSEALTGNAIDVAPDGTIRILDASTAGLFLRELPGQPWARGALNVKNTPSSLNGVHIPFDAAQPPRSSTYLSSVSGHCTDILCRGGPAMAVPHDGAWVLGWNQGFPLTYDGFQVDGVGVPLLGLWRP